MVINGETLLSLSPIKGMTTTKEKGFGVSHGLGEAGYDIRIKQSILFRPADNKIEILHPDAQDYDVVDGRFTIASAIEEFQMPDNLVGIVHDKSTWARRGLSVFNTVIEPGFIGGLTLELVYHGNDELVIPAGAGIAQVIFHELAERASYNGKYQHQSSDPVGPRFV